jgi:FAD/FMN-containing dehydrogenases
LKGLRKDNTGYDYKQLFIGSEGSLGVITKVALLLAPKPKSVITTFLACDSYEKVVLLLKKAKDSLGEILSTYEFIDSTLYNLLIKHIPNTRNPFSDSHNFYILIETSGSNSIHDTEKMSLFFRRLF